MVRAAATTCVATAPTALARQLKPSISINSLDMPVLFKMGSAEAVVKGWAGPFSDGDCAHVEGRVGPGPCGNVLNGLSGFHGHVDKLESHPH
eukprot:1584202-Rhodomonas_salina.1